MKQNQLTCTSIVGFLLLGSLISAASAGSADAPLEQRLDSIVTDLFPTGDQPGLAVLVMVDGTPVLRKGYGLADLTAKTRVAPDTIFRIGSITKQFTAVAVLQLVAAGKVSLDDPITKYVPGFDTQGRTITVENLLTHTSGLFSVTALENFDDQITKDITPAEGVALIAGRPLEFEPGARFKYSNTNYLLLGMVIEKASGQPYAEYIRDHIARPLGLADTRYSTDDDITDRHARGYENNKSGQWAPAAPLSMTQPYAAGAIESTVDDLAKWMTALGEGKVVDPALLERAWTPFAPRERPSPYGYGWNIRHEADERWIRHGGAINGFISDAVWIPEKRVFVAVLCNSLGDRTPELLLKTLALEAVGRPAPKRDVITLPVLTLDRCVGVYAASPELKFTFSRDGQKLFVAATGKTKIELFAEAEDSFFAKEIDAQFRFMVDGEKASAVTVTRNGREMSAIRED